MPPAIVRKGLISFGRPARHGGFPALSLITASSWAGRHIELLEFAGFSIGEILQRLEGTQYDGFAPQ